MKDWLVWFLLAIGLFVGEMFTAGFWLACLAVGAAVAGVVGLIPGLGFVTQGVAFAVSSIVSMAGLRPRLMHLLQLGPGSELRTGVDALLGKTGTVTERIGPRSEEHTSELQSRRDHVCRLLLEKKKKMKFVEASKTTAELLKVYRLL